MTILYAIVGSNISHTLSPKFYNYAFKLLNIDAKYSKIEIAPDNFATKFRELLSNSSIKGLNITVPFKQKVVQFGELDTHVKHIGAANTLNKVKSFPNIKLYNTDWIGFARHISELTTVADKRVLVLGAGGAARAIIYALKHLQANKIYVWNRTYSKALQLAQLFNINSVTSIDSLENFDILVNTTSVGWKKSDPPLFNYSLLHNKLLVYDINYAETPLIKAAKAKNARAINGLKMLFYQAIENLQIWLQREIPSDISKQLCYYLQKLYKSN